MNYIYSHTMALCPVCKQKIPSKIIQKDQKVFMEKYCPQHGMFEVLISSDVSWYEESRGFVKPSQRPLINNISQFKGCPDSCGFCPEHQQHTCLPVIEITNTCDLSCPICLKDLKKPIDICLGDFQGIIDTLLKSEGVVPVVNLSGGEPTLHPEFREMVKSAYEKGVTQVTVSTNGLSLLRDPSLRSFFRETGTIAAVQFDGFDESSYQYLRGKNLLQEKLQLFETLEKEGNYYSLVCTIAQESNINEVKKIADFFFESKALSVMFQPACYTGSAASLRKKSQILTIPDIVRELEQSKYVQKGDFNPLPCSHYSCFALSYYLKAEDGVFYSLKDFLGQEDYLCAIANKTLPGLDSVSQAKIKERIYELWSASDSSNLNEKVLKRMRKTLLDMNEEGFNTKKALNAGIENMKAVFVHHFMDIDTMDFGRLMKCCNPYPQKDGRLIPMCAQNVFFQ